MANMVIYILYSDPGDILVSMKQKDGKFAICNRKLSIRCLFSHLIPIYNIQFGRYHLELSKHVGQSNQRA